MTTSPRAPAVTIIVVSWNTAELLARCLTSMAPEAAAGRAAVCVVDNDSSDGSADMVARDFGWATLIRAGRNLGFGAAVNLGVERSEATDWLAPCNADVALEAGSLSTMLAAGQNAPEAGVIAPLLTGEDGEPQHSVFPFPDLGFTLLFNLGLHWVSRRWADRYCVPGRWNRYATRPVPWAIGAFLLVRRSAWEQVGGFDEQQWMYAEDLDIGWRLARARWSTLYVPGARVRHHGSAAATQAWGDDRHARWMDATYAWMLRRQGPVRTRAVAFMNVAGATGRTMLFRVLSRRWPERFEPLLDENIEWRRLHRIGLAPRGRIGTLSAAGPSGHRD